MRSWICAVEAALYCPEVQWQIPLGSMVHTLQVELASVNIWIQFRVGSDDIEKLQAGGHYFACTHEERRRLYNACEARLLMLRMSEAEARVAMKIASWHP